MIVIILLQISFRQFSGTSNNKFMKFNPGVCEDIALAPDEIVWNAKDMLVYLNKDLICKYANSAYLLCFGIDSSKTIHQMHFKEILGPLYNHSLPHISTVLSGKDCISDHYITLPNGSVKKARISYILHMNKGVVKGFFIKVSTTGTIPETPFIDTLSNFNPEFRSLPRVKDILEEVVLSLKSSVLTGFTGIATLSKKHHISESKLKRDFRERFGDTIFSFYRNLQMELAHDYITTKRANKSQMAHILNFANPSNFSARYRSYIKNKLPKCSINKVDDEKDKKSQTIIDQTPVPIVVLDNRLHILKASEEFVAGHRLHNKNYVGKHLFDIWPESEELYREKLELCLIGQVSRSDGSRLKKTDGTSSLQRWDIRPWYNAENCIGGALIYSESITEETFREEYKKIDVMLDVAYKIARVGAWELDFINNTVTWNSILKEILEVPESFDPNFDNTLAFCKDATARNLMIKLLRSSQQNCTPFSIEIDMVTAKGNAISMRAMGFPDIVNGKCGRMYGIFQDSTNYKCKFN